MQNLGIKAIKSFAPLESYQVINISQIERFSPQSDAIFYGITSTDELLKIESFLLPFFPSETYVEILQNENTSKVILSRLSKNKGVDAVYVKSKAGKNRFEELLSIVSTLRSPGGCPWDLEQTSESIKGHLIEEAYEVVDTINRKDYDHLKEELGDLLLQVLLHSQIASQCGKFTLDDVLTEINEKLIRRHPHVFADGTAKTPVDVISEWEIIKKKEKEKKSYMEGIPKGLPSLNYAQKLQTKASRVGFDWLNAEDVLEKIDEEVEEFKKAKELSFEEQEEELGDILFAIVNYGRKVGIDSESALLASSEKFKKRFQAMESISVEQGKDFAKLSLEEKEKLWERVKSQAMPAGRQESKVKRDY